MSILLRLIPVIVFVYGFMKSAIQGVIFKKLTTHADNRGFFREIIRSDDPDFSQFGQISHSLVYDKVIKAWHHHKKQTDYWYVASGVLRVGLFDLREDSPTQGQSMSFLMGDHQESQCLTIPPGVAHGCKAIQGPAHVFYIMTHLYDPSDEYRLPYNDPKIPFDWVKDYEIS